MKLKISRIEILLVILVIGVAYLVYLNGKILGKKECQNELAQNIEKVNVFPDNRVEAAPGRNLAKSHDPFAQIRTEREELFGPFFAGGGWASEGLGCKFGEARIESYLLYGFPAWVTYTVFLNCEEDFIQNASLLKAYYIRDSRPGDGVYSIYVLDADLDGTADAIETFGRYDPFAEEYFSDWSDEYYLPESQHTKTAFIKADALLAYFDDLKIEAIANIREEPPAKPKEAN